MPVTGRNVKESGDDAGTIDLSIEDLVTLIMPRLLGIKEKIDAGAMLAEADIQFMAQVTRNAQSGKQLKEHVPDWQKFYAEVLYLYGEIIDKAIDNIEKI